jgi:UDP-N-acetylmuramate dehydrogenase
MLNFQDSFPLKNITTLNIGGPASKFVEVQDPNELLEAIQYAKDNNLEYLVIGGGSNLLVSDEGVDKLILKNEILGIEYQGNSLKVKSGIILQDLVDYSITHGLYGLQKMTGIPGSLGGAVYGNAGAYGQTISDHLTEIIAFNGEKIVTLTKADCDFNYRDSIFKKNYYIILEVKFELTPTDSETLKKEAEEVLSKRLVKYPPGIKCPGSFFKNIVADTLPKEILEKVSEKR